MSEKLSIDHEIFKPSVADELRLSVAELNQSVAYLSKMVLQLQKSINDRKNNVEKNSSSKEAAPETLH